MDLFVVFFRDIIKGPIYYLYLILGFIIIFYALGIVADRRRTAIAIKLKEKKKYDIESGKEAAIAAMETKQVLDADDNNDTIANGVSVNENANALVNAAVNNMANTNDAALSKQEEKAPTVMVLNSSDIENNKSNTSIEKTTIIPPKDAPTSQVQSPVQAPVQIEPVVITKGE
ncbi:MAG: hypothetical protein IJ568_07345 [Bacilli bacterium]|nr:hypothetical protein [Bacilli bacterium]